MSTHTDYKGAGLAVPAYPPTPRTVVAKRYYALPTWTVDAGCEGGGWQEYIACDCMTREAITYRNDYVTAETPEKLDAAVRAAVPGAMGGGAMSAFERLERSGDGRRRPGLNIILTPSGIITVSLDAYEALGSPDRVYLLYDRDGRRIGIEAAADNGAGAYKMSLSGSTTTRQCSGRRYFTHYDISWRGKLAAHMEDGVLVASLPAAGSTSVSVAARKASAA